jgi:hypothetical protein
MDKMEIMDLQEEVQAEEEVADLELEEGYL